MNKYPPRIWRDSQKLNNYLGKVGKLLTFTTIYSAPLGFEHDIPYHTGIVKFKDGQALACQIVDCNKKDLKIGLKVHVVIRRMDQSEEKELIEYTVKVKPQ